VAFSDLRLAVLTLAQRWRPPKSLDATVLLVPSGDPTGPLFPGAAPFAGTAIRLRAAAVAGLGSFPSLGGTTKALTLPAPTHAASVFAFLKAQFSPQDTTAGPQPSPPPASLIRKALPATYLAQLPPGSSPSPLVATADEFGCAVRGQQPTPLPARQPDPSWGEVISHALRNPALATALGLRYAFTVDITDPAGFADGGWLFVTLDANDGGTGFAAAWAATPDAVKTYAARLPALAGSRRAVFTAVLFPVANPAAPPQPPDQSLLDTAITEAEAYDDGFAKLVHGRQPDTLDAHIYDGKANINPATDAGIQLGWDDEQVLTWHNRQIAIAQAIADGNPVGLESPLGVQGYRVDVRVPVPGETPAQRNQGWRTLMGATAAVPPQLRAEVPGFDGELTVEPAASAPSPRPGADRAPEFWLPLYFAQWRGTPLGVRDDTPHLLAGGVAAQAQPPVTSSAFTGKDVPALLYGTTYEMRVRLADVSGGGPGTGDLPVNETISERARVRFSRFVPPKGFRVSSDATAASPLRPTRLVLRRPIIGYPEALFTPRYGGNPVIREATRAAMLAQLGLDPGGSPLPRNERVADLGGVGVPDPDVTAVEIRLEVRALAHDSGDDVSADGVFTHVYTTVRDIPPLAPIPVRAGGKVSLTDVVGDVAVPPLVLQYVDLDQIAGLSAPAAGPLPVPRARDVRLIVTPIATGPPGYFGRVGAQAGRPAPTRGASSHVQVRAEQSAIGGPLLVPPSGGKPALTAMYFQPAAEGDPVAPMMADLAAALDLDANGLTLRARPGQRVVFGGSGGFTHTLAPNGSEFTFGSAAEVFRKWTVALNLELSRDWTWDGLQGDLVTVQRGGTPAGTITVPRIASAQSLAAAPDRTATRLVFLDGVDPAVPDPADGFTDRPAYQVTAAIPEDGGGLITAASAAVALRLPVVVPPSGTPQLVSAGYALSPYQPAADYSATSPRTRNLWLQLESPPAHSDALFARVLAYAPDPLLYVEQDLLSAPPPAEPALPLDPEAIRLITPGQPRDDDGLEAMTQLTAAAGDPRAFLLPLPADVLPDDPRLFGLWTYELRFGHVAPWSTAHGRFGRPLRVTGVQHPAPSLPCAASWRLVQTRLPIDRPASPAPALPALVPPGPARPAPGPPGPAPGGGIIIERTYSLVATAPYATPVLDGRRVGDGFPRTVIGFLVYAQARQADGSGQRNILLAHQGATPVIAQGRVDYGTAEFAQADVETAATGLGLPADAPISALAVEFYPPGGSTGEAYLSRLLGGAVADGPAPGERAAPDPFDPALLGRLRILRTSPLVAVQPVC
jgi:hypothetical protein